MLRKELFNKSFSCLGQTGTGRNPVRWFQSEATRGGLQVRFRHCRRSHHPSQILLDKFVKHAKIDSSIVVKAPFSLKVKGSYFDVSNNVDRERNRQMWALSKGFKVQTWENPPETTVVQPKREKGSLRDELFALENNILDSLVKNLSQDFSRQLKNDTNMLKQSNSGSRSTNDVESGVTNDVTRDADVETPSLVNEVEHSLNETSPLHVMFYGSSNCKLDSYSVLNAQNQHQSYVYLSEASQYEEETESMFHQLEPTASVSIWQPKKSGQSVRSNLLEDEMVSGFKIFCPYHLLDMHNSDLKAVFFVPVSIGKVYLQADREGQIDVDGTLLEDLSSVGLYTEIGNLKVRDLEAIEIKLASRMGDILCEGVLDGHIVAETFGDGDFVARSIEGPSLTVSTEDGDIVISSDCFSAVTKLGTRKGSIHTSDLYSSKATMEITEAGNITTNIISGSLNASVQKGCIFARIETLHDDSILKVENGEINVTLPQNTDFRIHASAPRTNIPTKLLNSGEIFLSETSGHETFVSNAPSAKNDSQPTLTLFAKNGTINIITKQTDAQVTAAEGFDSA